MLNPHQRSAWLTGIFFVVVALLSFLFFEIYNSFLATRSPQAEKLNDSLIGGKLNIHDLAKGKHVLTFSAKGPMGESLTDTVEFSTDFNSSYGPPSGAY